MHLLIYYEDVDELRDRLISVWCELHGPVCCEPRHRRVASSGRMCRRWRRTFWTLLM